MDEGTAPSPETIEGVLQKIIYQNEENGYGVALLAPEGRAGGVVVTGNLGTLRLGEKLRCRGTWTVHPRFGRQFKVEDFEFMTPGTRTGIIKYLSGGRIKGIGPKLAEALVDHFGTETLNIIDEAPQRLREVPGIGVHRLEEIRKSWGRHKGIREILVFLQGYGLGPSHATKVYREYGNASVRLVTRSSASGSKLRTRSP
jgi:exodeoxyribonuclease V alpha subunit